MNKIAMASSSTDAAETAEKVADSAIKQLDIFGNLFSSENIQNLLVIATRIAVVVLVLVIFYRITITLFRGAINQQIKRVDVVGAQQLRTFSHLIQSILFYSCLFIGGIASMGILGFDMRGMAASAGVAGLVIAFVSQSIIKDWICGIFIIVESQYQVGDVVQLGTTLGRVQRISIRDTVLVTDTNQTVFIPNGSITEIINYSKLPPLYSLDIGVSYDADINGVKQALQKACDAVNEQFKDILLEPCRVLGIQSFAASAVMMRMCFNCKPFEQFAILRQLREEAKHALDAGGFEIPYDIVTVVEEKNNTTARKDDDPSCQ